MKKRRTGFFLLEVEAKENKNQIKFCFIMIIAIRKFSLPRRKNFDIIKITKNVNAYTKLLFKKQN